MRKLYMAAACWTGAGLIIYFLNPSWWTEILMLLLIWLGVWWAGSFFIKKRRLSFWIALAAIILLVLKRFEMLNWISFGAWLVATGLIAIWA